MASETGEIPPENRLTSVSAIRSMASKAACRGASASGGMPASPWAGWDLAPGIRFFVGMAGLLAPGRAQTGQFALTMPENGQALLNSIGGNPFISRL